ncbi:MAG: hypothetical protein V3T88_03785 [Nitrosomonadaceae bacterium]
MTSIAWDRKILAADGRATAGNKLGSDDKVKIVMDGKSIVRGSKVICYTLCGRADLYVRIGDWIKEGCPVTEEFKEMEFGVLIITEDAVYDYGEGSHDIYQIEGIECLGSGGEFAHSAIMFGKNAIEAVQHAAKIDIYSGGKGAYVDCRSGNPVLKRFDT